MKKIFILLIGVLLFFPIKAYALENIDLYLFYSDTCPHCAEEKEAIKEWEEKYPSLEAHLYEVTKNKSNLNLLAEVGEKMDVVITGVPFTVIGDKYFIGYSVSTKEKMEETLEYYNTNTCVDVVGNIVNNTEIGGLACEETSDNTLNLPLFGNINTKKLSLPIITILIGLVDGFNPCAMWILLFLISMLLGMKNKKRMWALGLAFIVTSGVVYFAFMAAWLNLIMFISAIVIIRYIIGILGIGAGAFNLRSYIKERKEDGCQVIDKKKRKTIFEKIKKFTHEESFIISLIGIIILAVSVNLIEMACSLGLPAIYVQILDINNVSVVGRYAYLFLYIIFFMLDDILIFSIAMLTLKVTGISTKYSKYSHLIGGIIMVIVGILLIFAPELLMFG